MGTLVQALYPGKMIQTLAQSDKGHAFYQQQTDILASSSFHNCKCKKLQTLTCFRILRIDEGSERIKGGQHGVIRFNRLHRF